MNRRYIILKPILRFLAETIVAKQSKHMDFFRLQKEDKPERKITVSSNQLPGVTTLTVKFVI